MVGALPRTGSQDRAGVCLSCALGIIPCARVFAVNLALVGRPDPERQQASQPLARYPVPPIWTPLLLQLNLPLLAPGMCYLEEGRAGMPPSCPPVGAVRGRGRGRSSFLAEGAHSSVEGLGWG